MVGGPDGAGVVDKLLENRAAKPVGAVAVVFDEAVDTGAVEGLELPSAPRISPKEVPMAEVAGGGTAGRCGFKIA
jgi:hypothetical protein